MGHLVKGRDGGGTRYFLDDRSVNAGTALELRLPGDLDAAAVVRRIVERHQRTLHEDDRQALTDAAETLAERWVSVGFETDEDGPWLHLRFGGAWETWRPPAGKREGDDVEAICESCEGSGRRRPGDRCERCGGKGELRGVVVGDPDKALPCDVAHHGTAPTIAECEGGRVAVERACSDCEGRGKRWGQVERPYGGRGVLRGDRFDVDLTRAELRWPKRPR